MMQARSICGDREMKKEKTLAKKIWSRLIVEAIIGLVVLLTYPNWDGIKAAFKD